MTSEEKQKRLRFLQLKKKKALALSGREPAQSEQPSLGGFLKNVATDAREQGEGILALGGVAIKSAADLATGRPVMETEGAKVAEALIKSIPGIPGAVIDRAGEIISDPLGEVYKKPITTTLDIASVVPAAGGIIRGGKALSGVARKAISGSKIGVRALEAAAGAPRAAIERRLARPTQVRTAIAEGATETPYAPLADEVARAVNEVGEKARTGAAKAQDALSSSRYLNDRAIPKDDILKIVVREKSRLRTQGSVVGESKQSAMARLAKLEGQIKKLRGETVSEKNVKSLIKSLDPDINWKATENAPTNIALERVRYRLDAKLKKGNPKYREEIAPVARQMRVFKRSQRQFGLEKETGGGFVASDATASKLKSIGSGKVPMSERRLGELGRETSRDFTDRAKDIDAALKFEGGATQGSRRVVSFRDLLGGVGAGAGAMVGGVPGAVIGGGIGGAAGSLLGLITDTNGRKIAAKIIDRYLAARPSATAQELISANPELKALIRYSMYKESPQAAAAAYLGFRFPSSMSSENR